MSLFIRDDNENNSNNSNIEEYIQHIQQQFVNELNDDNNNLFFLSSRDYVNDSNIQSNINNNNISLSQSFDIEYELNNITQQPISSISFIISLFIFIIYFTCDNSSTLNHSLFVYSIYYKNQYYRLLTNNFVHSNLPQVLYNVFMFIYVYSFIEQRFGTLLSLLLFFIFTLLKSLIFTLCAACDLIYFGEFSIENGFTLIIIAYITLIALASEHSTLIIFGIIYYVILYLVNYIYEPLNLWYGVIVGFIVYVFNKFILLLPKIEWIISFERRFALCNDVSVFGGRCIVYYSCSERDQDKIKKYF